MFSWTITGSRCLSQIHPITLMVRQNYCILNTLIIFLCTGLPKRCFRESAWVESFCRWKFWFLQMDWLVNSGSTGFSSLHLYVSVNVSISQNSLFVIAGVPMYASRLLLFMCMYICCAKNIGKHLQTEMHIEDCCGIWPFNIQKY